MFRAAFAFCAVLSGLAPLAHAQWVTQSIALTNGWNAVYLHVDATHQSLNTLVAADAANPILAVWRWNPASNMQFVDNPQDPIDSGSQWMQWSRSDPGSALQSLAGNSAYLVRVGTNVSSFTWSVQGRPLAPNGEWASAGANLLGFPTVPGSPPTFDQFLGLAPELRDNADIFYYPGGELGAGNPARLLALRALGVTRGQAYWVRAGASINRYYGPFEVRLPSGSGVDFETNFSTCTLLLRNRTAEALTITASVVPSEAPPAGQPAIVGAPPLLVRGALSFPAMTYAYTRLSAASPQSWSLAPQGAPGSEMEVVLGLDRRAMASPPGALFAAVLRLTDSLGQSRLDVGVRAAADSAAGLWVGRAMVSQVGQYRSDYRVTNGSLTLVTNGQPVPIAASSSIGDTPRAFPLRLIVHNPSEGNAALLQRVFFGTDLGTNAAITTSERALHPAFIREARRISATHLPFAQTNAPWMFDGRLGAQSLTARVSLGFADHASNPFLHTYHPDHDNLDAGFAPIPNPGSESYSLTRDITLNARPAGEDFASVVEGTRVVTGEYLETLSVLGLPRAATNDTQRFQVRGSFTLNRISDIPTLTIAP